MLVLLAAAAIAATTTVVTAAAATEDNYEENYPYAAVITKTVTHCVFPPFMLYINMIFRSMKSVTMF